MKAILSYGSYMNQGKCYQAKFVYENDQEPEKIQQLINSLKGNIIPYKEINSNKIVSLNIPNDILLSFIQELINTCHAKIVIGSKEYSSIEEDIKTAIDNLHINIHIKKGKYFNLKDCYYAIFKYANIEQIEEVNYDFNMNLNQLLGHNGTPENNEYIFPFKIDKSGNLTIENTGIIGGTNIPEQTLLFFIIRFVKSYNAVITIGNEKFKDLSDAKQILQALNNLNQGIAKVRKKI